MRRFFYYLNEFRKSLKFKMSFGDRITEINFHPHSSGFHPETISFW